VYLLYSAATHHGAKKGEIKWMDDFGWDDAWLLLAIKYAQ